MNVRTFRVFFAVVFFVSIATRLQSIHTRKGLTANYDISEAISDVLNGYGLVILENPVLPPLTLSDIIYFEQPGCRSPSIAMPFWITINALTKLKRVLKSGYVYRFHYFNKVSTTQNRIKMNLSWIKYSALSVIGVSPYLPVKKAIVVAEPLECFKMNKIDWQLVWMNGLSGPKAQNRNSFELSFVSKLE